MSVHTYEGIIEKVTGAAVLFWGVYWEGPLWFPLSQSSIKTDVFGSEFVILEVRDWLAQKRNLQEFTYYNAEQIEEFNNT